MTPTREQEDMTVDDTSINIPNYKVKHNRHIEATPEFQRYARLQGSPPSHEPRMDTWAESLNCKARLDRIDSMEDEGNSQHTET